VVEGYPVYSVHQYAMAHMALAPIQRLTGASYLDALYRGMDWLYGQNPLGASLVEASPPISHRAIQRRGGDADGFSGMSVPQYLAGVFASLRVTVRHPTDVDAPKLELLREARPYELGWLLYANALVDRIETTNGAGKL